MAAVGAVAGGVAHHLERLIVYVGAHCAAAGSHASSIPAALDRAGCAEAAGVFVTIEAGERTVGIHVTIRTFVLIRRQSPNLAMAISRACRPRVCSRVCESGH